MTDRAMLTVSHFCTLSFTNEEFCITGRPSFLSTFRTLLLTAQRLLQQCWKIFQPDPLPRRRSNRTKCRHEIQPGGSEANPSLCLNDPQWCDWGHVILHLDFRNSILPKCTSSNTAASVSCKRATMLAVWLFTGGTSYLPPMRGHKWRVSLSGLGDPIWVTSLKPPPATIVLSTGVCSMSGKDKNLLSGRDKRVSYLAGMGMHVPTFTHSFEWLGTFAPLFLVPLLIEVS